jgi:hypothetical protein
VVFKVLRNLLVDWERIDSEILIAEREPLWRNSALLGGP